VEECKSAFKILNGTRTEKRPLEKPGCGWEDNVRIDLKEIGVSMRNLTDSA
jgi:hypothetical protein